MSQHLSAMLQKKISQPEAGRTIDTPFINKILPESSTAITYQLYAGSIMVNSLDWCGHIEHQDLEDGERCL